MTTTANKIRIWPHAPSAKQLEFLKAPYVPEVLYGGAAGSGKSDALLMAASQHINSPHWHALLVRKTYADLALPGALMDRAIQWWANLPGVKFNRQSKRFTWPSGATITFGNMDSPGDEHRYQGAEFTYVGFDEASQLRPEAMIYLASRIRTNIGVDLPLQMRYASNPGNIAHDWLRERFVKSTNPDCLYIPAFVSDNPGLDAEAYQKQLELLDPVRKAQLLWGDWDVAVESGWIDVRRIWQAELAPADATRIRAWDLAAGGDVSSDYTVGVRLARDKQGRYIIEDVQRGQWTPAENEARMARAAGYDPAGTMVRVEQEPGSAGKAVISHIARNVLPGFHVQGITATGDKTDRAAPLSAAVSNDMIGIVAGAWNTELIQELNAFPMGVHDDQVDALAMAYNALSQAKRRRNWDIRYGR